MTDRNFRLSKHVRPARCSVVIDVDLAAWRFSGHEEIEVRIAEATPAITLHAIDLEIPQVDAILPDGHRLAGSVTMNPQAETATFTFPQELPPGNLTLAISFRGEILARLRGFYRSTKDGARYAATQFEAADARRALPCFDEPEFKARFALTLRVPADLTAISNGAVLEEKRLPGNRKEVRFAETPPISSYLLAYTVGPYEATPVAHTPSGVPVRVWLPHGMADKGIYARDAHVRSLAYLEDYTGIPYPYGKVDAIGIPDFEAGAMENPGAITYRMTAIAADEASASTPMLKGIFYTAAHELTHMWWGDLVTMAWWNDLWLNESFATFIGYKVVADLVPEWGLWRDFVATLARPFSLDALASTHPISFDVDNARQATERFDVITYWKGAGVVRMIEAFLGAETFRTGVRTYLQRYREGNATADDFWRELSTASGRDVARIANAWIRQPGHPLVSICGGVHTGGRLSVTQKRFFAGAPGAANDTPTTWPVPMVFKYANDTGVKTTSVLADGNTTDLELPAPRWFYPNAEATGFYRFALDDRSLSCLGSALAGGLTAQERLSLIGNQWALTRAGQAPVPPFIRLVNCLRAESDRAVLGTATGCLFWLDQHVVGASTRPDFARFVSILLNDQFAALGWDAKADEPLDDRQRRAAVIGAIGHLARRDDVLRTAAERLERYFEDRKAVDPNLVSTVVELAARHGDAGLYKRYRQRKQAAARDPEEEQRFLFGLAGFEEPELIRQTLNMFLSGEIRAQDRAHLLARMLARPESRTPTWAFVRDRWDDLTRDMDPMLQQNLVRGLAQLTPPALAAEVRDFLPLRRTEETKETIEQALERLSIDSAAAQRMAPELATVLAEITE